MKNTRKLFIYTILIFYCGFVLYFTIISRDRQPKKQSDLSLLHTYYSIWHYEWQYAAKYVLMEVIGNVIMFLPFGVLVESIFYPDFCMGRNVILGLAFSMSIECIQYLTGTGVFQLVDMVHNTVGAVMGSSTYFILGLWKHGKIKDKRKEIWRMYSPIIILLGILAIVSIRPILKEVCSLIQ